MVSNADLTTLCLCKWLPSHLEQNLEALLWLLRSSMSTLSHLPNGTTLDCPLAVLVALLLLFLYQSKQSAP